MSWSVGAIGKAPEVRKKIAEQFANATPCVKPEETIRMSAAKLLDLCLEHQHPEKDVNVSAYGSQYKAETGEVRNSLAITVSPQG